MSDILADLLESIRDDLQEVPGDTADQLIAATVRVIAKREWTTVAGLGLLYGVTHELGRSLVDRTIKRSSGTRE